MKNTTLFSPIRLGGYTLKNRIVMPAMLVAMANQNGEVTPELIEYYEARAKGEVGLIIVEAACVDVPGGREGFGQLNIDNFNKVPALAKLADVIKAHSTRAFIQLFHAGRQTTSFQTGGVQAVAPSPIPCKITREMPRELTITEIKHIENKFIIAANYAHLAGFEGVEIHAAHGYLINQFLSSNTNQRTDEYGGSLTNRMRILSNIVKAIKNSIPTLVLSVRLNIDDFIEGGLTPSEATIIARAMEDNGVDMINCSAGIYESGLKSIEPASYPEGWRVYLAEQVKRAVQIPVVAGGVIRSPEVAKQIIAEGSADLVFVGRSLIADPDWAHKARLGHIDDIRPCIMCNNCIGSNFSGKSVTCTVNPKVGREGEFLNYSSFLKKHRIATVGSGPAGLTSAIYLARLGFRVSLFEKGTDVGGQLNLAHLPPYKGRIKLFLDYLKREILKEDVDLHLNYEFTPADVKQDYDMVIVATGSKPKEANFLLSGSNNIVSIEQVLTERVTIKNSNLVIIGGGSNGCEVADFLLNRHNTITIVEQAGFLAQGMEKKNRRDLMLRLASAGVNRLTNSQVMEISNQEVKVTGLEESIKADYIILAMGYEKEDSLYKSLASMTDNLHIIGDAFAGRGIKDAVFQGYMMAKLAYKQFRRGI